jgi:hypothetical protein
MTLIHIEFIKMFYMSLKYIHSILLYYLYFSHTGPFQVTLFFQGMYHSAHFVTRTLTYVIVY